MKFILLLCKKIKFILFKNIQNFLKYKYKLSIMSSVAECGEGLRVNGKSFATKNTYLGKNVNFNGMKITGGGAVYIDDYFHSGQNCQIITSIHNYEGSEIPYDSSYIDKSVTIEKIVWLGNNVNVLGGRTIGEGAIIQAGSVVCKNIPKYAIAGGHPAVVFKYRDIEHYNTLKKMNKFH